MIQFSNSLMIKIATIFLLAVIFLLPFFSAQNFSPASDEVTHLPSGYSYWKTGQITLNPQHPPFVKLIASFPLLFMDLKFDSQDPDLSGPFKNEWTFGKKFLISNDADRLLFWGRLPVMLLSVLLGLFIYKWASEMFSPKAGLLSLFLYAFMPNIIAHAQFVTTDLALASFSFIAFYYLWKFFKTNFNKHLIYSGLFLGLALSSKFSAVLFLPVVLFLIFIYAKSGRSDFNLVISRFIKITATMIAPAFLVVYFSYLMPADLGFYLRGMSTVYADSNSNYNFYLNGQFSPDGWRYYFLEAFLIKTPIPALIAFAAALIFWKKININNRDKLFIFLPLVSFSIATSLKAHDIGVRYLLPAFPFLILYTGGLSKIIENCLPAGEAGKLKTTERSRAVAYMAIENSRIKIKVGIILIFVLAGWYVFSAISIYPDYIAYFNEFVGGPANGYKYLDDSNLEWRHDLKRLAEYQKKYSDTKMINSDFNIFFDPKYYGIKNIIPSTEKSVLNPSGKYAINIHFLIRLKELSRKLNDKNLDWLSLYQPIDRIGYSFWIYEF